MYRGRASYTPSSYVGSEANKRKSRDTGRSGKHGREFQLWVPCDIKGPGNHQIKADFVAVGDWFCSVCYDVNFGDRQQRKRCEIPFERTSERDEVGAICTGVEELQNLGTSTEQCANYKRTNNIMI